MISTKNEKHTKAKLQYLTGSDQRVMKRFFCSIVTLAEGSLIVGTVTESSVSVRLKDVRPEVASVMVYTRI